MHVLVKVWKKIFFEHIPGAGNPATQNYNLWIDTADQVSDCDGKFVQSSAHTIDTRRIQRAAGFEQHRGSNGFRFVLAQSDQCWAIIRVVYHRIATFTRKSPPGTYTLQTALAPA